MAYSLSVESITVRNGHSRLAVTRSAEAPCLFARLPTVMLATGLGRSTIYRLVASGAFPAPVHLGPRAVACAGPTLTGGASERGLIVGGREGWRPAIGRELFSKSRRPTAIQCITDDMAAGLIASAHERRLLLPEALSVSGFDNFGLATRLYPALSTAALPLMSMAVAATRQVRETLEGRPVTASQQFNCDVVLRESIGEAVGN
jgi:predicted DNA-binding transcriptional regulator AlpA